MSGDSSIGRLVSVVVSMLVGAWLLSQIGVRLAFDVIVAIGKGLAGLAAGFFGFRG